MGRLSMLPTVLLAATVCWFYGGLVLATEPKVPKEPATLGELRQQVAEALRDEARSARKGENPREVIALAQVWLTLASDERRDESPLIQKLGLRVRTRLVGVKRKVEPIARPKSTLLAQQLAPGGGGPAGGGPQAAVAQGVDYGPELADLIERVISPEVWDINGGPGTVAYYAPGRALVVRAPAEVHHQVGQLVEDLRAARGP